MRAEAEVSLRCLLVGEVVPVGVDAPEKGESGPEGTGREKLACPSKGGTAGSKVEVFLPLGGMVDGSEKSPLPKRGERIGESGVLSQTKVGPGKCDVSKSLAG